MRSWNTIPNTDNENENENEHQKNEFFDVLHMLVKIFTKELACEFFHKTASAKRESEKNHNQTECQKIDAKSRGVN